MKVIVTAKLSDHKLTTKLTGLIHLPLVEKIFLIRRTPLPITSSKLININPRHRFFKNRIFFEFWRFFKILHILRKESIEVVIGIQLIMHGIGAVLLGWLTKTPSVISLIGADIHYHSSRKILGPVFRAIIKKATIVTIMGPRSIALVSTIRREQGNIFKALNCQDEERFEAADSDKKWDLICIGHLIKRKRIDAIIRVVEHVRCSVPEVQLAIIGSGPEENSLKQLVSELNLGGNVSFLGEQDNVEKHLQSARLLVMASRIEALPAVALEAMFCGIPAVLGDVCDIPEIFINERNCLLVDVDDQNDLNNAVSRLLSDKMLYSKCVEGLETSREKYIKRWGISGQMELWQSILTSTRTDI